jgi:hypothetical protein
VQGKTNREAIRCLKRHIARRIWRLLHSPPPEEGHSLSMIKINNFQTRALVGT